MSGLSQKRKIREQDKKMTVIEALFLGLIQGVTEFLPISSSAHLIIFRHFMKIEDTQTVFFNVLLHFGSMIAILLTFSKEWKRLFLALCGIIIDLFHNLKEHFSSQHQERKQYRKVLGSNYRMLAFLLILTTIPTAVIGGMIQSLVTLTSSNLLAPGVGLYLTAILLVVADMLPEGEKTQKNLKPKDALIAGFFQGFSTIPGLSRLGSTISACVIGGMTRSYAVKYSLIVSVPAIIGATIVEIATMGKNKIVFHPVYLVGVFMAALAGYFTIRNSDACGEKTETEIFCFVLSSCRDILHCRIFSAVIRERGEVLHGKYNKGKREDKEKNFCFRNSKKETDPNNGQKNNGEKEQYRKTYLRHKEKHSP